MSRAAQAGDPLARQLIDRVVEALIAGSVSLIHAFNPHHLIFGGGVTEGQPELVERIAQGVYRRALKVAAASLQILPAKLGGDAGVVGAAAFAIRSFTHPSLVSTLQ